MDGLRGRAHLPTLPRAPASLSRLSALPVRELAARRAHRGYKGPSSCFRLHVTNIYLGRMYSPFRRAIRFASSPQASKGTPFRTSPLALMVNIAASAL